MANLIANKSFNYATRALRAGDVFSAVERDARVLIAIGKAKRSPVAGDELATLREEYLAVAGVKADGRWGSSALRDKIAAAKGDMGPAPEDLNAADSAETETSSVGAVAEQDADAVAAAATERAATAETGAENGETSGETA